MDFKELETFMKLLEHGTYSLAAQSLFVSQPTVSTRIKSLEKELGVTLFKRSAKGYIPTDEGNALADYAKRILQIKAECYKTFSLKKKPDSNNLHIGTTASGTYILPDITSKFKEHYPNIKPFFSINNTHEAFDNLNNGIIDAVLAPLPLAANKNQDFCYIPVGYDALALVASSKNPLSKIKNIQIKDLNRERFIVREHGSDTRRIFEEWFYANGLTATTITEISQPEAIRRSVAKDAGLSLLSLLSLQPEDVSIKVLNVEGLPIIREFYIITLNEQKQNPRIQAFILFVQEFMKDSASMLELAK